MALIVAMVILGLRRMDFKTVSRQYDAFWNSAEKCATMEQFTENLGKPVWGLARMASALERDEEKPEFAAVWG